MILTTKRDKDILTQFADDNGWDEGKQFDLLLEYIEVRKLRALGFRQFLTEQAIKSRLEYLRGEIVAERISYGEIVELQSLVEHIDGDVLLLEWAGVKENE